MCIRDRYQTSPQAKNLFEQANRILGFELTKIMFEGTDEELKQTNVTQPAIFLHSVILAAITPDFAPDMVAVSYTHLDVYKRQAIRSIMPATPMRSQRC